MAQDCSIKKRWLWVGVFVGAWTALALIMSVETYVGQLTFDKPVSWTLAIRRSFKEIYACAFLSLGILWLCKCVRLEAGRRARWILLHMLGAVIFSVSQVALVSWLEAGEQSVQTGKTLTFSYLFGVLSVHHTVLNLIVYWLFVLGNLGWQYYEGYREREQQAGALATELVQARLQALRMQLNPHFLFNTLNTISALIHENPEAADRMLVRLSELLRQTLDQERQEVPLREEIEFLKRYLEIEQMRFPDRLTVAFDIESKAQELLVPHLILQPLVENALRHGIEPREGPGRIEIGAHVSGETLELKVRDNGNGLAGDKSAPAREGIGLKNVRSRLAHLYGSAQRFEIQNAPGGGVECCVRIPCCNVPRSQAPRVVVMSAAEAGTASLRVTASAKPECG